MRVTSPRIEVVGGRSRRGGFVLASVLASCVLLLSAQAPARNRGGSVLQSWILSAIGPLASGASWVSRSATSAADSVGDLFRARTENAKLKGALEAEQRGVVGERRAELVRDDLGGLVRTWIRARDDGLRLDLERSQRPARRAGGPSPCGHEHTLGIGRAERAILGLSVSDEDDCHGPSIDTDRGRVPPYPPL